MQVISMLIMITFGDSPERKKKFQAAKLSLNVSGTEVF